MNRTRLPVRLRGAVVTAALAAVVGSVLAPTQAAAAPVPAPVLAVSSTMTPKGGCTMSRNFTWESRMRSVSPHPRVVYGAGDRATIRRAASDPETKAYAARYLGWAQTSLERPLPKYTTGPKARMGNDAVGRIISLGYGFYATDDRVYTDRIRKDVAAIVAFPEWRNEHFLDTAELAAAVSIGYSIASRHMTIDERARTRRALVDKALTPASCLWRQRHRQIASTDNWAVVTNAAMGMAALVVSDGHKAFAAAALSKSLYYENRALAELSDGGTAEGSGYHNYIGFYASTLTASMERAFGSTGLSSVRKVPGFAAWSHHVTGPSGLSANFGDSDPKGPKPQLAVWNGYSSNNRLGSWLGDQRLRANSGANPLFLVWRNGTGSPPRDRPIGRVFPKSGLASLRSGLSSQSTWLAMKGGSNEASHSQLQLGSFVLEMSGQRFVSAYGLDNYSLPGYFSPRQRATYFRNSTAAASTMSRRDENQTWSTKAPLRSLGQGSDGSYSVRADLSDALRVPSARRTATLLPDESIRLVDEVSASSTTPLRWRLHTEAYVSVAGDGRRAVLSRGGKKAEVVLDDGTPGRLVTQSPPSTPGGRSNTAFTILQLDTTAGASSTLTVSVRISPLD